MHQLKRYFIFVLFVLAQSVRAQIDDGVHDQPNSRRIALSEDLFPADHLTNSVSVLNWQEPISSPIYCTGTKNEQYDQLKFSCPLCNNVTLDQLLEEHTLDLQKTNSKLDYAAIKLYNMPVDGAQWNGRMLRCSGIYHTGIVNYDALVNVIYLKKPAIVGYDGRYPLSTVSPPTFYYDPAIGFNATCRADGNPAPKQYQWLSAGREIARNASPDLRITENYAQLSCKAESGTSNYPHPQESYAVSVLAMAGSNKPETNLEEIRHSMDPETNSVTLGTNFNLQCTVSGSPKATVRWLHANTAGVINEARCYEQPKVQERRETVGQTDYWYVTSECKLNLDDFDAYGHYWCLGCIEVAQNRSECSDIPDKLHKDNVFFNVTGAPKLPKSTKPRAEHIDGAVVLYVPFCSNPVPIKSKIYWTVDNEKVFLENRLNNIFAKDFQKNPNHPLCYEMPLLIKDPQNSDKSRSYKLYIENSQGHIDQDVPVGKYLTGNDTEDISSSTYSPSAAFDSVAIGVAVAVVIFVIVGLCLCAYLWFTSKACFSFRKAKGKTEKYQPSVASSQLTTTEMTPEKQPNGNDTDQQQSTEVKPKWSPRGYNYVSREVVV